MTTHTIDIAEFEAFCRSKPEGEGYEGYRAQVCAIAQFLRAKHGTDDVSPDGPVGYLVEGFGRIDASSVFEQAIRQPHTFSALADRLAELGR